MLPSPQAKPHLSKSHHANPQDVSWRLMPGQRVGLVGANGCGKSTLLRCLSGQRKIDNGRLVVGRSVEMGYLEQTAVSGSDRTVWEEARSRMTELIEAEAAIDAASQAATAGMVSCSTYIRLQSSAHACAHAVAPAHARASPTDDAVACLCCVKYLHMPLMLARVHQTTHVCPLCMFSSQVMF